MQPFYYLIYLPIFIQATKNRVMNPLCSSIHPPVYPHIYSHQPLNQSEPNLEGWFLRPCGLVSKKKSLPGYKCHWFYRSNVTCPIPASPIFMPINLIFKGKNVFFASTSSTANIKHRKFSLTGCKSKDFLQICTHAN